MQVSAGTMRRNSVLREFLEFYTNGTNSLAFMDGPPFTDSDPKFFRIVLDRMRGAQSTSCHDLPLCRWELARFGIDTEFPRRCGCGRHHIQNRRTNFKEAHACVVHYALPEAKEGLPRGVFCRAGFQQPDSVLDLFPPVLACQSATHP